MPLVSIITVCYGSYLSFLPECAESVAAQTWRDFEWIILTDKLETASALVFTYKKMDVNWGIFVGERFGLSTSKNAAINLTHGDYIVNIDADDKIHPQFVEKLVAKAGVSTLVCPGLKEFDGGTNFGYPIDHLELADFKRGNRIFCASMFSKRAWEKAGGYDPGLDQMGWEDWALWIRMMEAGCHVEVVPELLYYHRGRADTGYPGSVTDRIKKYDQERAEYFKEHYLK